MMMSLSKSWTAVFAQSRRGNAFSMRCWHETRALVGGNKIRPRSLAHTRHRNKGCPVRTHPKRTPRHHPRVVPFSVLVQKNERKRRVLAHSRRQARRSAKRGSRRRRPRVGGGLPSPERVIKFCLCRTLQQRNQNGFFRSCKGKRPEPTTPLPSTLRRQHDDTSSQANSWAKVEEMY